MFSDNQRVTDLPRLRRRKAGHRLDKNFHNIDVIMEGKLSEIISELQNKFNTL